MKQFSWAIAGLAMAGVLIPVWAKSPVAVDQVAPAADLVKEAQNQRDEVAEWSATAEAYQERKADIRRAGGLLAALGQALAEHPKKGELKLNAAGVRDAGLALVESQNQAAAQKALKYLNTSLEKKADVQDASKTAWKELMDMDDLMHVVNQRNSRVRRVARRSRDPEGDSLHATTIAVLSLVMAEQTDHLGSEADVKAWKKYALDFQKGMTDMATALKKKDKAAVQTHLEFATKACNDCHAQFRD